MYFEYLIFCSGEKSKIFRDFVIFDSFNLNQSNRWSTGIVLVDVFYSLYTVHFKIGQLWPRSTCTCIAKSKVADRHNADDTRRRTKTGDEN